MSIALLKHLPYLLLLDFGVWITYAAAVTVPICAGKAYYEQPIKYYYSDKADLCVGVREGCDAGVDDGDLYDDLQSCINDNMRVGHIKTVFMYCAGRQGVLRDSYTGRALITSSCKQPDIFCGPEALCYNATTYAYCCRDGLPDHQLSEKYSAEYSLVERVSPCLKQPIKFFYDDESQLCIAYRDGCEKHDVSYATLDDCMRMSRLGEILAHRIMHRSYFCPDGYTPATIRYGAGGQLEYPLQAVTKCEAKQFCDSDQLCMQRAQLGYCCVRGQPGFRRFDIKKLE